MMVPRRETVHPTECQGRRVLCDDAEDITPVYCVKRYKPPYIVGRQSRRERCGDGYSTASFNVRKQRFG